jgi:uncharacterized membrane protein
MQMKKIIVGPGKPLDYILPALTLIASWAIGAWFYMRMPETVAVHWGINGTPDRYGSRIEGALGFPIILTFLMLLFFALSRTKSGNVVLKFGTATALFLISIQVIIGLNAIGVIVNVTRLIVLSMAGLFVLLGLFIPMLPQNRFGGFRNKYTLSNMRVWESTNRVGGKMMMAAGLLMVPFAFTPPLIGFIGIFAVIIVCVAVVPFLHSMSMYRKVKAQH